jgi:hypothetical protein
MAFALYNNDLDKTLLNQYRNSRKTKELTNDQALSGCAQLYLAVLVLRQWAGASNNASGPGSGADPRGSRVLINSYSRLWSPAPTFRSSNFIHYVNFSTFTALPIPETQVGRVPPGSITVIQTTRSCTPWRLSMNIYSSLATIFRCWPESARTSSM